MTATEPVTANLLTEKPDPEWAVVVRVGPALRAAVACHIDATAMTRRDKEESTLWRRTPPFDIRRSLRNNKKWYDIRKELQTRRVDWGWGPREHRTLAGL